MKSMCAALIVFLTVAASSVAQTRDDASPGVHRDEGRAAASSAGQRITMDLGTPTLRTLDEAKADARTHIAPQRRSAPFRPTMTAAAYAEAKAAANRAAEPGAMLRLKTDPQAHKLPIVPQASPVPVWGFDGVDQVTAGGWYPPDTHGAIGINYFVEVTNSHLDIYSRASVPYGSVALNGFFPYYTQPFFDPRVIYDAQHDRFVVLAAAFPESSTVQRVFIAASVTGNPTGSWYVSSFNVTGVAGDFFDFPQLGVHSLAAIFTANIFDVNGNYKYANVYTVKLSDLYGGNPNPPLTSFVGLSSPSIAPPIVRDTTLSAFLISAAPSASVLKEYQLLNLGGTPTLYGPYNVIVGSYTVPPSASQPAPCGSYLLDTSDSRFVNASTQVGYTLYQVHTIAASTPYGTRPRPRFYVINADTANLLQLGDLSASATSYDWNASIAATLGGDLYLGWSSTDPARGLNAQVVVSGKEATDAFAGPAVAAYTSSTCTTQFRWGDYSAVTFDPLPTGARAAYFVNETILDSSTWGSRIVQMAY